MPKYNHRYEEIDGDTFEVWTDKSGQETKARLVSTDDDDDDDIPFGCQTCGNCDNYPACREGCLD